MEIIIKLIATILIILIFIYSKLKVHENLLFSKYKSYFKQIKKIIAPVLGFLDSFFKPIKIGNNLFIDSSQFVLLVLLLLILNNT